MNLSDLDPSALSVEQRIAIVSNLVISRALELAKNFEVGNCATLKSPFNKTPLTMVSLFHEGLSMISLQEGDPRETADIEKTMSQGNPTSVGIFVIDPAGVAFVPYGQFASESPRPTDDSIAIANDIAAIFDEATRLALNAANVVEAA